MSKPSYSGFFINLDSNSTRLASITRQLADVGLHSIYQRFAAVNGRALGPEYQTKLDRGNLGLWLTQERLLGTCERSKGHLHILEDDALLPKDAATSFEAMLRDADTNYPDWDIILTEISLQIDVTLFQILAKNKQIYRETGQVGLFTLKPAPFAGTSSLFINQRSIDKYLKLIAGKWTEGIPIDIYLRSLIRKGALNGYVTFPFLTSLSEHTTDSNIQGPLNLSRQVMNLYRRATFKDADLKSLGDELNQLALNPSHSDFTVLYLKILSFFLSGQHVPF
jgi:GR25 family glycosyltransferase involved in LPS biosynthesis